MPPFEFTPELDEAFYQRLARRTGEREARNVGLARSEALARGQAGDPLETSLTGEARSQASQELSDIGLGLGLESAGRRREERLIGEGRTFETGEAEKDRAFRERMSRLGYEFQTSLADTEYRRNKSLSKQSDIRSGLLGQGFVRSEEH